MEKEKKKIDTAFIASLLMFIVPFVLGCIFYNRLPQEMAIHFDSHNQPNGFAPKYAALFGLPLFMLIIHIVVVIGVKNDPKSERHAKVMKALTFWLCPVLCIFIQITTIAYGLGSRFDISTYVLAGTGVLFTVIGNYLPKSRQNYTIGFKLPWTLNDEQNWNKTHRMAGKLWVIGGLLITIFTFTGLETFVIALFIAMAIIPMIYSFVLYKAKNK